MEGMNESLDTLAEGWLRAKCKEERAREERLEIEEQMLPLLSGKLDGAVTTKLDAYAITVKYGLNRSLDKGAEQSLMGLVPPEYVPIKHKPEVDAKGLEWLSRNQPHYYDIVSRYITTKSAKPSFKIVRREQE